MLPGIKKRVLNLHDVLMYVAIARKHLRLMALLVCFSWLAGLVFYVYARPVYYSRALVKVNQIDRGKLNTDKQFDETARIGGIIRELRAPHIIQRAAAGLGVRADHRDVMKDNIKKLDVRKNSEMNIEIEVYPYTFDWAKRWSEKMVTEFIAYREERRRAELDESFKNYEKDRAELHKLIDERIRSLAAVRTELKTNDAKMKIAQYMTLHEDILMTSKRIEAVGHARVHLLDPSLDTIAKLSLIEAASQPISIGAASTGPLADPAADDLPKPVNPTIQVITPAVVGALTGWHALEKEMRQHQAKYNELGLTLLPGNVQMLAVQKEVDAVKLKLEAELASAEQHLETEFSQLLQKQKELNAKLPGYEAARAEWLRVTQVEQTHKKSMVNWDGHLAALEKDMQEKMFAIEREKVELKFHGILQINDLPVSPNRFSLILYTTLLGLALAIGIPFLIEYLDHTLSNLEQVESTFQLRGLGIIPKLESAEASVALIDREQSKQNNLLENFRVIRTNLLSMGSLSKPPHVMMVTSAMPKEGKTVVSSNLALSFAQTGGRTLLMDTDLRRGRLHRLFGYRKQPGLSGVLLGEYSLEEAVRPTQHENMFILSAGKHVETGTELLGSQKFKDIMAELRGKFDRIVVDTPPVLGLSETSILQNQVDGVLFVIWSGHTPIKGVKAAIEMLQANGANFYGFVLNRLDLSATANYYQYYYYSHDYYYHYSPRALENT